MREEMYGPFGRSRDEEELRLSVVEKAHRYVEIHGPARNVERMEICTDTGIMHLPFSYGKDPRDEEGNKVQLSFKDLGLKYEANGFDWFRDWRLSNAAVYTTEDPGVIFVECDGQSLRFDPRFDEVAYYLNHYLLPMRIVDGKIDDVYEIMNTAAVFENFQWGNREPKMF